MDNTIALSTYCLQANYKTLIFKYLFKIYGAGGGTRTHTPRWTTEFESVSSANSNTPAYQLPTNYNIYNYNCKYLTVNLFLNFLSKYTFKASIPKKNPIKDPPITSVGKCTYRYSLLKVIKKARTPVKTFKLLDFVINKIMAKNVNAYEL